MDNMHFLVYEKICGWKILGNFYFLKKMSWKNCDGKSAIFLFLKNSNLNFTRIFLQNFSSVNFSSQFLIFFFQKVFLLPKCIFYPALLHVFFFWKILIKKSQWFTPYIFLIPSRITSIIQVWIISIIFIMLDIK